jgi:hypothetical protein
MNLFACDAKCGAQFINTGPPFATTVAQTHGSTVESAKRSALHTFAVVLGR